MAMPVVLWPALATVWLREFWTYASRTDVHAVTEREWRARLAEREQGSVEAG